MRYVEQLRRYQERFGRERMLVLVYDDFRADNEATVRRVLRFLEVDDEVAARGDRGQPDRACALATPATSCVHAVSVGRGPLSLAVKGSIKALTPTRLRRRARDAAQRHIVFAEPSPPDAELMAELRRRFTPEVEALSEYLGRDLVTLWGYDAVGR